MALTDANGDVTDTYSYDAWGNVTHESGTTNDNPYQYVGQLGYYTHWQEQDFSPLQLGVRYYDPGIGRFTSRDPAKDGWNHYEYAGSNPVLLIDPNGAVVVQLCYMPGGTINHGKHSWLCIAGQCWGLHPQGDGKKKVIGPGEIVDDGHYMEKEEKQCFAAVVSNCIADCLAKKIEEDQANPPYFSVTGRFGTNCRQWVGGLFWRCGYPMHETLCSSIPSSVLMLASYVNTGSVSNDADRNCECAKK